LQRNIEVIVVNISWEKWTKKEMEKTEIFLINMEIIKVFLGSNTISIN